MDGGRALSLHVQMSLHARSRGDVLLYLYGVNGRHSKPTTFYASMNLYMSRLLHHCKNQTVITDCLLEALATLLLQIKLEGPGFVLTDKGKYQ